MFYLGGPVWGAKQWLGSLFPSATPARDFLSAYSQRLGTVEGNTTFYAMPSDETILRWRAQTPPGFRFCCKFPRVISHDLVLRDAEAATTEWLRRVRLLGDRAGPTFLQLPPHFAPQQLPVLRDYLQRLPRDLRFAVEVRHAEWFQPGPEAALSALLQELGVGRVLFDVRPLRAAPALDDDTRDAQERKPDVPVRRLRTAPFSLIRYVGHPVLAENGAYLDEWADTLSQWLREGTEAYLFLHYPGDVHVPALCRDLHRRLAARLPDLPALPAFGDAQPPASAPPRAGQLSLF